jgi:hypothetical protein
MQALQQLVNVNSRVVASIWVHGSTVHASMLLLLLLLHIVYVR